MRIAMASVAILAIAAVCVAAQGRDNVNLPFVDDPQVIGTWESVDFVTEVGDFVAGQRQWKESELMMKNLTFKKGGSTSMVFRWTKGTVIHPEASTASHYEIRAIDGEQYMFMEWKSGDYTHRGMKPKFYVLKKR
jgi:bla regulator protein BlaR1